MRDDLPRIWIGGTGRSGTTLLYELLRGHSEVHAFTAEMRFIIDPHGVEDLFQSLTSRFSTVVATEALRQFEKLLLSDLQRAWQAPYFGIGFADLLGDDYVTHVQALLDDLSHATYEGYTYSSSSSSARAWAGTAGQYVRASRFGPRVVGDALVKIRDQELRVPRYFSEPSELLERLGRFVDGVLSLPAAKHGRSTWCEKTPHNVLSAPFLLDLVPGLGEERLQPEGGTWSLRGVPAGRDRSCAHSPAAPQLAETDSPPACQRHSDQARSQPQPPHRANRRPPVPPSAARPA